jgi:hypothetical protein
MIRRLHPVQPVSGQVGCLTPAQLQSCLTPAQLQSPGRLLAQGRMSTPVRALRQGPRPRSVQVPALRREPGRPAGQAWVQLSARASARAPVLRLTPRRALAQGLATAQERDRVSAQATVEVAALETEG